MLRLDTLILLAGVAHLGILLASALVPRVLDWRRELAGLHPLSRQLVWVHGAFIVLVIVGFGVLSIANASALAAGTPLARWFCGFVALFWAARLAVQFAVFDASDHLTTPLLRVGYHGLTAVFAALAGVYGWAAAAPASG